MTDQDLLQELIGLPQAAEILGLHRASVNEMVNAGRIPGYRLGAHWFVKRSDIERFAHDYRRPKNAPRRQSRSWGESWKAEIVRWLKHWDTATSDELGRVIDLHIGNIRKYLVLLEKDSMIDRDEHGYWRLTASGARWASSLPPIPAASEMTVAGQWAGPLDRLQVS